MLATTRNRWTGAYFSAVLRLPPQERAKFVVYDPDVGKPRIVPLADPLRAIMDLPQTVIDARTHELLSGPASDIIFKEVFRDGLTMDDFYRAQG